MDSFLQILDSFAPAAAGWIHCRTYQQGTRFHIIPFFAGKSTCVDSASLRRHPFFGDDNHESLLQGLIQALRGSRVNSKKEMKLTNEVKIAACIVHRH